MLTTEEWMEIKDLKRQGCSVREIARLTGRSRNTVRAVLRERTPKPYERAHRPTKLDPFKTYLSDRYKNCSLSAVKLFGEIVPMGYCGSVDLVRRYVGALAPQKRLQEQLTVRYETPPGQQGQADWAYCGRFANLAGEEIAVYAFVMVLSFSRMLYVEFVSRMDLPTLLGCHQNAFAYLGGWPSCILYDNMKQVRIGPDTWNGLFLDFANYYGITPKTHAIRRPRTKGKVERMVSYVRDSFLKGSSFTDFADLNARARHWLEHVANVRVHATTGRRPLDLLAEEKLTAHDSIRPFAIPDMLVRTASRESLVSVDGSRYSVPPSHACQKLTIQRRPDRILIFAGGQPIADHPRAAKSGSCVVTAQHMQDLWKLSVGPAATPSPDWRMTFEESVAARPLAAYEEIAQ